MRESLRTIADMTAEERIQRTREILGGLPGTEEPIDARDTVPCWVLNGEGRNLVREHTNVDIGRLRNIVRSCMSGYDRYMEDEKRRDKKGALIYVSLEEYLNACFNDKFGHRVIIPDSAWALLISEERLRREGAGE